MKILILLTVSILLCGCSGESPELDDPNATQATIWHGYPLDESTRVSLYEKWSKEIGGQFWPFSLEEYEFQKEEFDVVYGLGGRWITARFLLQEGHPITKEEMIQRITQSLEFYEWKQEDLSEGKLFLTARHENSKNDLYFERGPFSSEGVSQYTITIHISEDAGVLVLYCEAGW